MFKKLRLASFIAIALTGLIISISVFGRPTKNLINDFNKVIGIKCANNDIIIELPTIEKNTVSNSIDPKSGMPNILLEPKAEGMQIKSKYVDIEYGEKIELFYTEDAGRKYTLIYDINNTQIRKIKYPNKEGYLIEYNNCLYDLDWDKNKLIKISNDEVGGYTKNKLFELKNLQKQRLYWIENANINPAGQYIIYFTNRCLLKNENDHIGETWIKNLDSGQEELLAAGNKTHIYGWVNNDTFAFRTIVDDESSQKTYISVGVLNIITGEEKIVCKNVAAAGVINGKIVYQKAKGILCLHDPINNEEEEFKNEYINTINSYAVTNEKIAMANHNVVIVHNVNTRKWYIINSRPEGQILDCSWEDSENLLINVNNYDGGNYKEYTYIVDINSMEAL